MKFVFHPEALFELEAAADFFADRQKGLEIRFIDAVYSAIHRACDAPERWRRFDGDIRRLLVHVFPYAVLYSIEWPPFIFWSRQSERNGRMIRSSRGLWQAAF